MSPLHVKKVHEALLLEPDAESWAFNMEPGSPIEVEVFGQRLAGQVSPDVLHDPEGKRLIG